MKNQKNFTTYLFSSIGIAAMFLILAGLYVIFGTAKFRIDLTQEKVYTLSKGTKAIIKKLDTPVQIRFYCTQNSSAMPVFLKTYAERVDDLLNEYRKLSGGNIEIKKFDPQPDSDAEDSANLDGIEGQMSQTGEKIYLGVAVSCLDAKVTLPYLTPERERLLEYDLSRAISQVVVTDKPVIGVMSALPVFGEFNPMAMQMGRPNRSEPWVFLSELKRDFNVKQVEMTADKIDPDIKVLLVVYPREISDKAQYAIDQYILRGGKVIAYLDPLSVVDNRAGSQNPMQRNLSSGASLDKLLKAWGIEFDKNKVVADMDFVSRINRGGRPESMPAVLSLNQLAIGDTNEIATSQIDSLVMAFAGVFTGTPADGLKRTVLLKTSENSQMVEKIMAEFSGEGLAKDFVPSKKEMALAIRLTGKFKTAFPEGAPKDAEKPGDEKKEADKTQSTEPSLKESQKDGVVVLVGDADMLYDQFCVQVGNFLGQRIVMPQNGNLNLLQNLVEQMAGDSNLILVRSRATMNRPFTVVKKMQAEAQESYRKTIQDLEKKLQEAQQRINDLQAKKDANQRFVLSKEQQDELRKFRQEQANVNKELKNVRKNLRRDVESLENRLKWINIAGMPFMVTLGGIGLAMYKRKKTAAK